MLLFQKPKRLKTIAKSASLCALLSIILGSCLLFLHVSPRAHLSAPEPSIFFRDRHGRFLGEVSNPTTGELGYWPVDALPERVVAATLAAEDRGFNEHPGIDPRAIARAVWHNLQNRKRQSGASTIAMQVARMQNPGARTYTRKLAEAGTALLLTRRYGRERVLRHYLTLAPYGNRIHGIGYAARRYLDKPVDDLSWAEIAFLASIPKSPATMNPYLPAGRARAKKRALWILARLREQQTLSSVEYRAAADELRDLQVMLPVNRPLDSIHALIRLREASTKDRPPVPLVNTTLDLELQSEVAWIVFKSLKQWENQGARNAAVIVVDPGSREVLAWVGSRDYFDGAHAGSIDYTNVPRSPGSALKPFFYALALERGILRADTVLDDLERGAGGITNADDRFLGPMLPRAALANSRNVPAANLLDRMGVEAGYEFLRQVGLHDNREPARRYGLGLAIGGLPVTLEQLVHAYTVLAGEGLYGGLIWYREQPRPEPRRLLSEEAVRQINLYLSDPMARLPSFARMGSMEYPFPVAVKTGTSSRFRDAWAVAYSNRALVGVWVGDPDFQPMNRLSGFNSAAEIAKAVLTFLHRDQLSGMDNWSFPPPRGYQSVRLCALSGRLATPVCEHVSLEWFAEGDEPAQVCSAHVQLAVDSRTGRPAQLDTPPASIEVRTFLDLPPRYAEWMVSQGLALPPLQATAVSPVPADIRLHITSPGQGLRLLRDPETPADQETIALKVVADPSVPQVLWYVDGEAFQVADYPYTARWPVQPGEHVFQAQVPLTDVRSGTVRVVVE
ncbi:MAG: glycosyl transferase [Acidobacteria bacterium]|nr:MAG: glycosyl transferase [Acidobacteriota bacterium]